MSNYDFDCEDKFDAEDESGEFGFDYDSDDVLYHYDDGFATGSAHPLRWIIDIVLSAVGAVHFFRRGSIKVQRTAAAIDT